MCCLEVCVGVRKFLIAKSRSLLSFIRRHTAYIIWHGGRENLRRFSVVDDKALGERERKM